LLDWSLTNKNQLSFNPENVKISDLIDENINLFKNLLDIKKIELKIDLDEKTLLLDRHMMSSAIRNILSNAIKLSPEKSRLIITGKVEENFYLLSFKDEAGGIPDEVLKSIFQNKEQLVDGKTTQSVGLGMRLIQLFILKNKAKLDIKNTKKGTRIRIQFPFTSIKS
jgi:K+-sensing histidine kinase KdpD